MAPIGGVGINLAVQDAVATARMPAPGIITRTLSTRTLSTLTLANVQRRRAFPRGTQAVQLMIHRLSLERVLAADASLRAPGPFRWLPAGFQKLPARPIWVGLRPERLVR